MGTVNTNTAKKTSANSGDYGSYAFKGEKYAFCVAKKFTDHNGSTIIAAPVTNNGDSLMIVSYDVNIYKARKQINICKAVINANQISSIKMVKLPSDLRTALESEAMKLADQAKTAKKAKPISQDAKQKLAKAGNLDVKVNNTPKQDNNVERKTDFEALFADAAHNKLQQAIAGAFHKVMDDRLIATPVSTDSRYEVLSPYKLSVRMDRNTGEANKVSGVAFLYCVLNINDMVEYYKYTSFGDGNGSVINQDNRKNFDIETGKVESVLNYLSPAPKHTNIPSNTSRYTDDVDGAMVITKTDLEVMLQEDGAGVVGDKELVSLLPASGAMAGIAVDFRKSFENGIKEKELTDWIKEVCKKIIVANPEIFKTKG